MAVNDWNEAELDAYGLSDIDIDWPPKRKLEALFSFLDNRGKPLPGTLFKGKVVVSKTELMRMAKIHPRHKKFEPRNSKWAADKLDEYVRRYGVALPAQEGHESEADTIERLRQQVQNARKSTSEAMGGMDTSTHEVAKLREENEQLRKQLEEQQALLEKQKITIADQDNERKRAMEYMMETGRRAIL